MKARRPLRTNPTVVRLILRTHATRPRRPDALAKPATCPSDAPPPTSVKAPVVMSPMRKPRTSQPGPASRTNCRPDDGTQLRRRQPARNAAGALPDVGRHALPQPHGLPAIHNNRLLERQIRTACASAHSPLIFLQPSAPTANPAPSPSTTRNRWLFRRFPHPLAAPGQPAPSTHRRKPATVRHQARALMPHAIYRLMTESKQEGGVIPSGFQRNIQHPKPY